MNSLLRTDTVKKLAWVYTVLILLLVALPINGKDQPFGKLNDNYVLQIRLDYLSHAFLFVPWVLLVSYGWEFHGRSQKWWTGSFLLALLFAAFCEYLQLLLPYRTFNINDLVSNCLSIVLGYLLAYGLKRLISYTNHA
ncbi:VanZ family protein [Spirosoma fluviale]|uniref:VanZ like family protein n=1 Tax=Spirosoma fluviale TaxID=1597977 RepID=A0A286FDL6_9BACT|nr:VanZ family protein [Spirosoma fluviale]SOD81283.1 VanZ like family protein [Spirosoma fluviale]